MQAEDERGEILVAIPRGESDELRLTLSEYSGRPYLMLQVWEKGRDGRSYPVRGKGVSVRVREVGQVIGALSQAAKQLGQVPASRSNSARPAKGHDTVITSDTRPGLPGLGGPVDQTPDDDAPF